MIRNISHTLMLFLGTLCAAAVLLSGCSTTACLQDDDVLYTGIKEITYNRTVESREKDAEVGVVAAVGGAVEMVADVIRGTTQKAPAPAPSAFSGRGAARAELRAEKERKAQFEAVQPEVNAVLHYAPNGALFGSSSLRNPLQARLRIYNRYHDSTSRFGKWMFKHFAEEPRLISSASPATRAKVATRQLHNFGYFRATTSYDILPSSNPKKAKVAYHVQTGPLFLIDSLYYGSWGHGIDSLLRATRRQRMLRKGTAFSAARLVEERTRIERLLRDNGYYYFAPSNVTYQADTVRHPLYVSLRVLPVQGAEDAALRQWKIGRVNITLYNNGDPTTDTLLTDRRGGCYRFRGTKPPVRPRLWMGAITHRPGRLYALKDQETTVEKLSAMGILSQISMDYQPSSTLPECDTLDVYVTAMMDRLYESSFEMNATLKSNNLFGPGLSYELARRNAFRGGEKASWRIYGSYEWYVGKGGGSFLNSYELGTELALTFPRFLLMKRRHQRFAATTKVALDVDWRNRSGYFNMLQFGVNATYNWHRRARQLHELTVFDLTFNRIFSTTSTFEAIVEANPALYVGMRNQFVPSIAYAYSYTSSSARHPLWLQLTGKEAGNLLGGIYAACGQGFGQRDKTVMGSPFAQFVKATAEAHKTWTLSQRLQVATRAFVGAAYAFGNSSTAPYTELFYVGGANSIRGIPVRAIGPGGFRDPNRRYAYVTQVGDFKMEANAELRARLVGDLHGAIFLDAGNVWLLRQDPLRPDGNLSAANLRRIALGTGIGLRYDLSFLVLRVDWGIALHYPYANGRSGFYNIGRFLSGTVLNFAIGYPF